MRRGEVWWVEFDERRPVVLLSEEGPSGFCAMQVVAPAVSWQLRRTRYNQDQPHSGLHTFAGIPHRLRYRLRRRALRLQERVGHPVAESQQAGSGQCCRQGAAPPGGVG